MKDLLIKEYYCYKIHTSMMKSNTYFLRSIDNPSFYKIVISSSMVFFKSLNHPSKISISIAKIYHCMCLNFLHTRAFPVKDYWEYFSKDLLAMIIDYLIIDEAMSF